MAEEGGKPDTGARRRTTARSACSGRRRRCCATATLVPLQTDDAARHGRLRAQDRLAGRDRRHRQGRRRDDGRGPGRRLRPRRHDLPRRSTASATPSAARSRRAAASCRCRWLRCSALVLVSGAVDLTPPAAPTGLTVASDGAGLGVARLDCDAGRGLLRRLPQPVHRRRLRAGRHDLGDDASPTAASRTASRSTTSSGRSTARATRAIRRTRCGRCRTSRSAGRTCSGRRPAGTRCPSTAASPSTARSRSTARPRQPGQTPSLDAQLGYGPAGSDPHAASWTWQDAGFNGDAGQQRRVRGDDQPAAGGELRLRLPLLDHRRP